MVLKFLGDLCSPWNSALLPDQHWDDDDEDDLTQSTTISLLFFIQTSRAYSTRTFSTDRTISLIQHRQYVSTRYDQYRHHLHGRNLSRKTPFHPKDNPASRNLRFRDSHILAVQRSIRLPHSNGRHSPILSGALYIAITNTGTTHLINPRRYRRHNSDHINPPPGDRPTT